MTAYVSRGDKVIVYAGNVNLGEWEKFLSTLTDEGVEIVAKITPAAMPAGRPEILAVIEPPDDCEMCGHSATCGMTLDGDVILDEAVNWTPTPGRDGSGFPANDCSRVEPHHPHPWSSGIPLAPTRYCKGIPS